MYSQGDFRIGSKDFSVGMQEFLSNHSSGQTFPLQWLDLLTEVVSSDHFSGKVCFACRVR